MTTLLANQLTNISNLTTDRFDFGFAEIEENVSPRSFLLQSSLVTELPVTYDIFSLDDTFPCNLDMPSNPVLAVVMYANAKGLNANNMVWLPVYRSTIAEGTKYSSSDMNNGTFIGFIYEDGADAFVGYNVNKQSTDSVMTIKARLHRELGQLSSWAQGEGVLMN